jgi:hypothetical protein
MTETYLNLGRVNPSIARPASANSARVSSDTQSMSASHSANVMGTPEAELHLSETAQFALQHESFDAPKVSRLRQAVELQQFVVNTRQMAERFRDLERQLPE